MSALRKYWPHVVVTAGYIFHFILPSLIAYETAHPKTTLGVLCGAVLTAYHARAPKDL